MKPALYTALTIAALGLSGLAGGLLSDRWRRKHQAALVAFAAGALLAAAFLDVLPEASAAFGKSAFMAAFGGFLAFALVEWGAGLGHRAHDDTLAPLPATVPASLLISDALHNVGDGAAVAAAFLVSPRAGVSVAIAVVAHEVPQEVGDYAILRAAGYERRRALLALAGVQLTAALGAIGVGLLASQVQHATGLVLSVAAGGFIYIGATDLMPELRSARGPGESWGRVVGFACGVLIVVVGTIVDFG